MCWNCWDTERVVSERLNSGPLPGCGIDCRVQRMALALRYHYSSIDLPALKSKSHLVAQAIVSGSVDWEICVRVLAHVCVLEGRKGERKFNSVENISVFKLFLSFWDFQRWFFFFSKSTHLSSSKLWNGIHKACDRSLPGVWTQLHANTTMYSFTLSVKLIQFFCSKHKNIVS